MKTLIERLREQGYGDLAAVVVSRWLADLAESKDQDVRALDGEQHYRTLVWASGEACKPPVKP